MLRFPCHRVIFCRHRQVWISCDELCRQRRKKRVLRMHIVKYQPCMVRNAYDFPAAIASKDTR
ncbi:MAG: ESPR-type extended signal peptide-containing protein [Rhodomicrobium sp.]